MDAKMNEIIGEVVREVLPGIHSGVLPLAHNPVTGEIYTGVNQMPLANRADRCGDGRFMTESEVESAGGKIRNKGAAVTVWLKAATGTIRPVKLFNVTDCSFPADSPLSGPEQRPAMHDMKQLREMLVAGLGSDRADEIDVNINRENRRRIQELINELCLSRIPANEKDPDLRELQAEVATCFICADYGLDYRVGRQMQQLDVNSKYKDIYERRLYAAIKSAGTVRRECRALIPAEMLTQPKQTVAANHEEMVNPDKLMELLVRYRTELAGRNQNVNNVNNLINQIAAEQSMSQAQTAEQTAQQAAADARDTEDTRNETKAATRERPLYDENQAQAEGQTNKNRVTRVTDELGRHGYNANQDRYYFRFNELPSDELQALLRANNFYSKNLFLWGTRPAAVNAETVAGIINSDVYQQSLASVRNRTRGITNDSVSEIRGNDESRRPGDSAGRDSDRVLQDSGVPQAGTDASDNPSREGLREGASGAVGGPDRLAGTLHSGRLEEPGSQSVQQEIPVDDAAGSRGETHSVHAGNGEGLRAAEQADRSGGREGAAGTGSRDAEDTGAISGTGSSDDTGSISGHGTGGIRGSDNASTREGDLFADYDAGTDSTRVRNGQVHGTASQGNNMGVSADRGEGAGPGEVSRQEQETAGRDGRSNGPAQDNHHHDDVPVFSDDELWGSVGSDAGGHSDVTGTRPDSEQVRSDLGGIPEADLSEEQPEQGRDNLGSRDNGESVQIPGGSAGAVPESGKPDETSVHDESVSEVKPEQTEAAVLESVLGSLPENQQKQLIELTRDFSKKWAYPAKTLRRILEIEIGIKNGSPLIGLTEKSALLNYERDFVDAGDFDAYHDAGGEIPRKLPYRKALREALLQYVEDGIRPVLNEEQIKTQEVQEQSVSDSEQTPETEPVQSASDAGTGAEEQAQEQAPAQAPAFTWSDNYHIPPAETAGDESVSAAKAFERNIAAIELSKKIEAEGRQATPDEKKILAGFTSWGGIGSESNERINDPDFLAEHPTLTESDVKKIGDMIAGEGGGTGYYTTKDVIDRIYGSLERFGFKNGAILEPSCGTGNFIGCLPESLKDSQVQGVELDEYSARIARQLYPAANIVNNDFLHTKDAARFDVAVGNVPFSQDGKSLDRKVAKEFGIQVKVPLHDAIIAQTLHEVRPGGICALITSTGTLDKTPKFRQKLAEQAEFVGAVRLPTSTFDRTETNSDLIILKRRDRPIAYDPEHNPDQVWAETHVLTDKDIVEVTADELVLSNGLHISAGHYTVPRVDYGATELSDAGRKKFNDMQLEINGWLWQHPEQIAGDSIELLQNQWGDYSLNAGIDQQHEDMKAVRNELIDNALDRINTVYEERRQAQTQTVSQSELVEHARNVRPQSFAVIDDKVVFKISDDNVEEQHLSEANDKKIRSLIDIRDKVLRLLDAERKENNEQEIEALRKVLNDTYDDFEKKYKPKSNRKVTYEDEDGTEHSEKGYIGAIRASDRLFSRDISWSVLQNMEVLDRKTHLFERKSDIFTRNVISSTREATHADNALSAMHLSISKFGKVDLNYMSSLMDGREPDAIIADLTEQHLLFRDPELIDAQDRLSGYVTSTEYLSGDIRMKIDAAEKAGMQENADALREVLPVPLTADQISVQLGAQWVPAKFYEQFFREKAERPEEVSVTYLHSDNFSQFVVDKEKPAYAWQKRSWDETIRRYDTEDLKATEIFEDVLNGKAIVVNESVEVINDKGETETRKQVNERATIEAQNKANLMREEFATWIWQDETRKKELVEIYNRKFNSIRPREYNGEVLTFEGMNSNIKLYDHQKAAIGRIALGKSTLLAHGVGAGKTIEMICGAMESKRLGICKKPLIVVPNAIVNQTADEFMRTYPGARLLVAEQDSLKSKRQDFCGKIVNGDYDCIIMTHDQFKLLNMSRDYKEQYVTQQLNEAEKYLRENKSELGTSDYKSNKAIRRYLGKLQDQLYKITNEKRDEGLTFEQLGIDRVFVDEAHYFKNLRFMTLKDGVQSGTSDRADDMYMKASWLNQVTGGRGMVFATGTPISNNISELYTMMRYLNHDMLQERGLDSFDAWASAFAVQKTGYEIGPTGEYQSKTRFAEYTNLPELAKMMGTFADIKMGDDLNLELPDVVMHKVVVKPSELQQLAQRNFIARGAAIKAGHPAAFVKENGEPGKDNFLKITNDGRNFALDPRLQDSALPDNPNSKTNVCVSKVAEIYRKTEQQKLTQMIFCDRGVPNKDGKFSVYDDIKQKLIAQGIPEHQIAFIHDAKDDEQKKRLFNKVQSGEIRILLGSTDKCGTGVNVQNKLYAVHHLDAQWRPSDLEQRNGRIIRQGNTNPKVHIFSYVTERTLDAFIWQTLERKQNFITQIIKSKSRSCEDQLSDDAIIDFEDIKNSASGDPKLKELRDKSQTLKEMTVEASSFAAQQQRMQAVVKHNPAKIDECKKKIALYEADIATRDSHKLEEGKPLIEINGKQIAVKAEADRALDDVSAGIKPHVYGLASRVKAGTYRGFELFVQREHGAGNDLFSGGDQMMLILKGKSGENQIRLTKTGNIARIEDQIFSRIEKKAAIEQENADKYQKELTAAQSEIGPYQHQQELDKLRSDIDELKRQIIASAPRLMIPDPEKNSIRLYQDGDRGLPDEVKAAITEAGWECDPASDRIKPSEQTDKTVLKLPEMVDALGKLNYKQTKVMQYDGVTKEEIEEACRHQEEQMQAWRNGTLKQEYEETITEKIQRNHRNLGQQKAQEKATEPERKPETEFVIEKYYTYRSTNFGANRMISNAAAECMVVDKTYLNVRVNRDVKENDRDPLWKVMKEQGFRYVASRRMFFRQELGNDELVENHKCELSSALNGIGMHEVKELTDTRTNNRQNSQSISR